MKTLIITFLVVLALIQFSQQERVRYDNYQVHRVIPKTEEHLKLLKQLEQNAGFDFWTSTKGINYNVDIMVPPYKISEFQEIIKRYNLESEIFINNVQDLINNERGKRKAEDEFGWDDYHTLGEINVWLSNLAEKYSDKVTLQRGGTSYEGRPIVGVHISFSPGNENRSVFIDGTIHACEWISSSVVTYILNQLLTSSDPDVREVAESHDWYIFPVINPDGFAYTHTTNRTWRKTRVPHGDCVGADPNRNWDYHFNEGGASDDPCSEMYSGPYAFSEPEMKSLSEYLLTIGNRLEGYFSFHSYHQALLLPYGYTPDHLDNYDELYEIGVNAIEVLSERYGTEYELGDVAELMYIASGGSPDWVKGTFGTRITYTYELRDTGEYGFLLPAELIIPTAEETFDSLIYIFQEFAKRP